jgi:hypothetical protein
MKKYYEQKIDKMENKTKNPHAVNEEQKRQWKNIEVNKI